MDYPIKTVDQMGVILRSIRKDQGLTQIEAGEKVGLLPKTVSALENNSGTSSIESLMKYLSALKQDIVITPRKEEKDLW